MTLDAFQKAYGEKLGKLLQSPELIVALLFVRKKRRDYILGLSDEEITAHSQEILGDIRGQLRFENDLMTLPTRKEFKLEDEEPPEYVSPEEAARVQDMIEKFRTEREQKKARGR